MNSTWSEKSATDLLHSLGGFAKHVERVLQPREANFM